VCVPTYVSHATCRSDVEHTLTPLNEQSADDDDDDDDEEGKKKKVRCVQCVDVIAWRLV
jgi:hypothetical protein